MNILKKLSILIVVILVLGCDKEIKDESLIDYNILTVKKSFWNISKVKINSLMLKENRETGTWKIVDYNGDTLRQGEFQDGYKIGRWNYLVNSNEKIDIDWTRVEKTNHKYDPIINYPVEWWVYEADDKAFLGSFETKSGFKKNKYFAIISHNIDSISMDLEQYLKSYDSIVINNKENVIIDTSIHKITLSDGSRYYFCSYTFQKNQEEVLLLSLLGTFNNRIYDFTYSSLNEERSKKHLIFFEIIFSSLINDKRFLSPFMDVEKFEKLPRITSEKNIKENPKKS